MTLEISGLAYSRVIGCLLGLSSFLYMIVRFTLSDAYTDLFLTRFALPDLIQWKSDSLSLTKTRFTLSDPVNIKFMLILRILKGHA